MQAKKGGIFSASPKEKKEKSNKKDLPKMKIVCDFYVILQPNQKNMVSLQIFSLHKEFVGGGKIEIMKGYVKKSDHKDLFAIARYFAERGSKVQITTNVHFKDQKYNEVFGRLNGTKHERKCPDLIINGKYYEYESYLFPFKKEKISHMIKKGSIQSSQIIINNNKGASDRYIRDNIYKRLKDKNFKYDINEVWLYEKGVLRLLYKKQ